MEKTYGDVENNQPPTHAKYFKVFVQKLSSKHSLKWLAGLIDLEQHTAKDKQAIWALENLSAAHAFDYILLRIKPGLTIVKTLLWPCTSISCVSYIGIGFLLVLVIVMTPIFTSQASEELNYTPTWPSRRLLWTHTHAISHDAECALCI